MEYLFQLIPEKSKKKVLKLVESEHINIIVTKKRISKHGDFRKKPMVNYQLQLIGHQTHTAF